MNITFNGESDPVLQDRIFKAIGSPLMSMFALYNYNEHNDGFSLIEEWLASNDTLKQLVLTISNERITLEQFMIQYYNQLKKSYVTKHMESIKMNISHLEKNLFDCSRFSNTEIIIDLIGQKRRLLTLIDDTNANNESSDTS